MSTTMPLPRFLWGNFDWLENGLYWNEPPPLDILSEANRLNPNPWIALAAAVERAKRGIAAAELPLIDFFGAKEPFALMRVALLVYGDVAPKSRLDALETVLLGDDAEARKYAADGAALSGALRLVPSMLKAWNRATHIGDRETIGFAISDMLEPEPGPIASQANVWRAPIPASANVSPRMAAFIEAQRHAAEAEANYPSGEGDDEEDEPDFNHLVSRAYHELSALLSPDAVVLGGAEWCVRDFAEKFLRAVQRPDAFGFIDMRHRFEASTGVDCRAFFHAGAPQRLVIQATLEDFLQSTAASAFARGQRYFFGRPLDL